MRITKTLFSSRKKQRSRSILKFVLASIDKGMEAHLKSLMTKIEKAEYEQHNKKLK